MTEPLIGGALIGIAASLLLISIGRVAGVSGILGGALFGKYFVRGEKVWRFAFLGGLFCGGLVLSAVRPEAFEDLSGRSLAWVAIAGLLVGFGTSMGSGCTSGHGVCGISRLSTRSVIATVIFMVAGVVTVTLMSVLKGGH